MPGQVALVALGAGNAMLSEGPGGLESCLQDDG